MFYLEDSFFQEEIRDGFYVSAQVKAAWAAELYVLYEIDRICKKQNIEYLASWGTYLGALRHGGIIPWDDDFDIAMTRENYDRFCSIAPGEFEEGFTIINLKNPPQSTTFPYFLARVTNSPKISFEKEHLRKYHNFPYIAGVDIFVLDYIHKDEDVQDKRIELINYIIDTADSIMQKKTLDSINDARITRIEEETNSCVDRKQLYSAIGQNLYILAERVMADVPRSDAEYVAQMVSHGLRKKMYFPTEMLEEKVFLPFEGMKMPTWGRYEFGLARHYRDYLRVNRAGGAHNYPFFENQKENFEKTSGMKVPAFAYEKAILKEKRVDNAEAMKNSCKEFLSYMKELVASFEKSIEDRNCGEAMDILAGLQNFSIDFGTWIEGAKWEGHICVKELEVLCEYIFALYSKLQAGFGEGCLPNDELWNTQTQNLIEVFLEQVKKAYDSIHVNLIEKEEIVFLIHNNQSWNSLKKLYNEEMKKSLADVFILPIPYYYKDFDGSLINEKKESLGIDYGEAMVAGEDFDLQFHQPAKIYFANPYDQWNFATSVNPIYYSNRLRAASDRLIYVQPYDIEDFSKEDGRSYKVMDYYVNMPGVLRADEIYVNSSCIRDRYIDKLVELTGESNREMWADRISFLLHESILPAESGQKKTLFIHFGMGRLIQYKDRAISAIKKRLEVMLKEELNLICYIPAYEYEVTKESQEYIDKFYSIMDELNKEKNIRFIKEYSAEDIKMSTAYYGTECRAAYDFIGKKKPVMICDLTL